MNLMILETAALVAAMVLITADLGCRAISTIGSIETKQTERSHFMGAAQLHSCLVVYLTCLFSCMLANRENFTISLEQS